MINIENVMFGIMTSLCKMRAPIVFKGAMVLKAIQYKYGNPSRLERETHDIDGDWVGVAPSMQYLRNTIQQAVYNTGYNNIRVDIKREYSENKSAGFNFYNVNNGDLLFSMDLSIRNNNYVEQFEFESEVYFYGQSTLKVVVDKIIPVSQRVVLRRVKDIIDLYILSFIWKGNIDTLYSYISSSNKVLGDFDCLLNRVDDLSHAYSKYKNKVNVLPFNQVYSRVVLFLEPFIKGVKGVYWDGNKWC